MDLRNSLPCSQDRATFTFQETVNCSPILPFFADLRNFLKPFSHVWLALLIRLIIQGFQPKNRVLFSPMRATCFVHSVFLDLKGPNLMFCWPCIVVYQNNETKMTHFLFSLLKIKGLYMFRALLAHLQEELHKRYLVNCVRIPSTVCASPSEDEQVMI
jgi:hypothetical protein